MVIVITIKESKVSHRINTKDEFIRDEFNNILPEHKLLQKARELAWDIYGKTIADVTINKN